MPFQIVLPVDGSEPAKAALAWAGAFAARTGARIAVCSVVDPMLSCVAAAGGATIDPQPMLEALQDDAARYSAAAGARCVAMNVAVTTTVLEGSPAAAIDAFAHERGADLIVVGTHARHGIALGILGSVTAAIVHTSRVAVVTVRTETCRPLTGPVVVAIDDSDAARAAATLALRIAAAIGAPVYLIHVEDGGETPAALAAVAREAAAAGLRCTSEVRPGPVAPTLIDAAADCGAALLATGTHGRGAVGRMFLGSVAERLIRGARTPVLVAR